MYLRNSVMRNYSCFRQTGGPASEVQSCNAGFVLFARLAEVDANSFAMLKQGLSRPALVIYSLVKGVEDEDPLRGDLASLRCGLHCRRKMQFADNAFYKRRVHMVI